MVLVEGWGGIVVQWLVNHFGCISTHFHTALVLFVVVSGGVNQQLTLLSSFREDHMELKITSEINWTFLK